MYAPEIGIKYFNHISNDSKDLISVGVNSEENTALIQIFYRVITNFKYSPYQSNIDKINRNILLIIKIINIIIIIVTLLLVKRLISNKTNNGVDYIIEISLILATLPIISYNFSGFYHSVLLLPAYIFILIILKKLKYPKKKKLLFTFYLIF